MDDLTRKIAEDICELNRWRTPSRIKANKHGPRTDLDKRDVSLVRGALEAYVPYAVWIEVWREQHAETKR